MAKKRKNYTPEEKVTILKKHLAEQVFEHLPYPYRAARNVYNMLNAEGYFF